MILTRRGWISTCPWMGSLNTWKKRETNKHNSKQQNQPLAHLWIRRLCVDKLYQHNARYNIHHIHIQIYHRHNASTFNTAEITGLKSVWSNTLVLKQSGLESKYAEYSRFTVLHYVSQVWTFLWLTKSLEFQQTLAKQTLSLTTIYWVLSLMISLPKLNYLAGHYCNELLNTVQNF